MRKKVVDERLISVEIRKKGGEIRNEFHNAKRLAYSEPTAENRIRCVYTAMAFFVGCRFANFLHDRLFLYAYSKRRLQRKKTQMDALLAEIYRVQFWHGKDKRLEKYPFADVWQYSSCNEKYLYHATPNENENEIVRCGLQPMKKPLVYMADNFEFYNPVRRKWFGESPILFRIDASLLQALGHSIYKTADGEYVTDFVPPECITVIRRLNDGILYDKSLKDFV